MNELIRDAKPRTRRYTKGDDRRRIDFPLSSAWFQYACDAIHQSLGSYISMRSPYLLHFTCPPLLFSLPVLSILLLPILSPPPAPLSLSLATSSRIHICFLPLGGRIHSSSSASQAARAFKSMPTVANQSSSDPVSIASYQSLFLYVLSPPLHFSLPTSHSFSDVEPARRVQR